MNLAQQAVEMLGKRGRDKISGLEGIITSLSLDLYGCAQVILERGFATEGKQERLEGYWMDIGRIEIIDENRIMPLPSQFQSEKYSPQTYDRGPVDKPAPLR